MMDMWPHRTACLYLTMRHHIARQICKTQNFQHGLRLTIEVASGDHGPGLQTTALHLNTLLLRNRTQHLLQEVCKTAIDLAVAQFLESIEALPGFSFEAHCEGSLKSTCCCRRCI